MNKDDYLLIEEILSGNLNSFDHLMERYQNLVYKISLSFGKTKENALDITQNVFLKAFQNLKSFRGKNNFRSWLSRIAYNEGQNWNRQTKRLETDDTIDLDDKFLVREPTQEDELLAREFRHQLLRSLFNLNTKYRLAVVLRYYQNMSIREIASILNCAEGVVKNMLYRSLQRLKESLKEEISGGIHANR